MTSAYLQSLGFIPTTKNNQGNPAHTWRYQYNHLAADGASLFIEHPLGIDACRLSTIEAPLAAQDVFASVGLNDRPALAAAMKAFYVAHGGMGTLLPAVAPTYLRPFHRQL